MQGKIIDYFNYYDFDPNYGPDMFGIIKYDDISFDGKDKIPVEIAEYMRANIEDYYDVDYKEYNEAIAKGIVSLFGKAINQELKRDDFRLNFIKLNHNQYGHTEIVVETPDIDMLKEYLGDAADGSDEEILDEFLTNLNTGDFDDCMREITRQPDVLKLFSYDLNDLNEHFKFKPEVEKMEDLQYYRKIDDEYVYYGDVEGQLKLKYETFAELNEALEKLL